jgi:hypothetical protein
MPRPTSAYSVQLRIGSVESRIDISAQAQEHALINSMRFGSKDFSLRYAESVIYWPEALLLIIFKLENGWWYLKRMSTTTKLKQKLHTNRRIRMIEIIDAS